MTEAEEKLLVSYAESRMNLMRAARASNLSRSGAMYRMALIRVETGLNPMNFYDLCKLIEMIKEGEDNGKD